MNIATPQMDWPGLIFAAEAGGEWFSNVNIVTTKTAFVDLAYLAAADLLVGCGHELTADKVQSMACTLVTTNKIAVQESVTVAGDGAIHVCMNIDTLDTDNAVWQAYGYVAHALDVLNGEAGTVSFSDDLSYTLDQVPALLARGSLSHVG